MLRVIQITDTHLFAEPDQKLLGCPTRDTLRVIVQEAERRRPDVVLLTGDQSQDGSAASYQAVLDLLDPLQVPCYAIPGNHDEAGPMGAELDSHPFSLRPSALHGGWHFILLDSQVPGAVEGALREDELSKLRRLLEEHPQNPTLIALHHPPFSVGSDWLDEICLRNAEAFFQVIDAFPQVRVVLCGHVHQAVHSERLGVHYYSTPSTCIQFALGSQTFAVDTAAQPGFRELELQEDGTFTTGLYRVPVRVEWDNETAGY